MQQDDRIILDLINEGYDELPLDGESENARKWRLLKKEWSRWWKEWGPVIWEVIKIVGILVILAIIGFILFWIAVVGLVLAAIGGGLSEGAQQAENGNQSRNRREDPAFLQHVMDQKKEQDEIDDARRRSRRR